MTITPKSFAPTSQPDTGQLWYWDSTNARYILAVTAVSPSGGPATPAVSAFGAASVVENSPTFQGDFVYSVND